MSKPKVERNQEESQNEDEDVQMEKARVKEALSCRCCEEVRRRFRFFCQVPDFFLSVIVLP